MSNTYKYRVQHLRGNVEDWEQLGNQFIPLDGELVLEKDNNGKYKQIRVGDGKTPYNRLPKILMDSTISCVSYSEAQNLTDEQKETARVNIGVFSQDTVAQMIIGSFEEAVPKSLVVDNLIVDGQPQWDKIPNGNALQSFIEKNAVSSAKSQDLTPTKKGRARKNIGAVSYLAPTNVQYDMPLTSEEMAQARTNIGAISQAELDEAIANAAGSGGDFISYTETQNLTDEQKRTARENIGVNTTVSITDDGYGNITLNTSSKKVEFTDDGNGNIKMEVM